ncbi:MAG: NAD(P)/FAD-dependent oxidoreductase [Bacteroidia bacterium]
MKNTGNNSADDQKHLVIVGGGFGGIELAKRLRKADLRITLIDKNNYHTFQPLLYQVASGGLGADAIGYPFRLIFRGQKNLRFLMTEVEHIDASKKFLSTTSGKVNYDFLVLATGSTTNYFGNKLLEKYAMPLKSIPEALNLRSDLLQEFEQAMLTADPEKRKEHLTFIVVGGGPTGVETAGALAEFKKFVVPHDYPGLNAEEMVVKLVEAAPRLLNGMSDHAAQKSKKYLEELGVDVALNKIVKQYDGSLIQFEDGEEIRSRTLIWSAGVRGQVIDGLAEESVEKSRFMTDEFLRVKGVEDVFAIGDVAGLITNDTPKGHPMVAPVAVQQGALVASNLKKLIAGQTNLKPFKYKDNGSMATVGRNKAVVDLSFWKFGGFFAWLIWMFLHLMLLVGFRNRLVVFIDWMWNYFSYERALRLIVRKYDTGIKEQLEDKTFV